MSRLLVLKEEDILRLLPMRECITVMAQALIALARGQVYQPLRTVIRPPEIPGILGLMPAALSGEHPALGLKAVCAFPANSARGKDSHQGAVILFDTESGEPLALLSASAITGVRTAAVTAVATELLARRDAGDLAVIGAGRQARAHLEALASVRSLRRVRIVDSYPERARSVAAEMSGILSLAIEVVESAEEAVRGADLVVTVTSSADPVLLGEWLAEGAHVNLVGASTPREREADAATLARARLFVDRRESCLNESGEYLAACQEGMIGPDHVLAELGELLVGERAGRTADEEITLFKSLGMAVEDVAAAEYAYRKDLERDEGVWVEL